MKSVNPLKLGVGLAALGGAFHLFRVVRVELGWAEPHTIGSLGFPLTALIIISGTAITSFIVGFGLGFAWNQLIVTTKKTRAIWLVAFIAVIAAAGSVLWAQFLRSIKVQVAAVQSDVAVQVFGLGTVEARVTSKIGFNVAGVLVDLRADVGDRVAKGAVLARLDDREQAARVARAKAAVEQTEANLQRARASVEKAQANFANAKSINARRQKLVQSNTTSVETAETAKRRRTPPPRT